MKLKTSTGCGNYLNLLLYLFNYIHNILMDNGIIFGIQQLETKLYFENDQSVRCFQ